MEPTNWKIKNTSTVRIQNLLVKSALNCLEKGIFSSAMFSRIFSSVTLSRV